MNMLAKREANLRPKALESKNIKSKKHIQKNYFKLFTNITLLFILTIEKLINIFLVLKFK